MTVVNAVNERDRSLAKARRLNRVSLLYNLVEAVVALLAGVVASSVSLVGFGLDSVIEVLATVVVTWRLAQENQSGCMQSADRRATRLVALTFFVLTVFVGTQAIGDLVSRSHADVSIVGIAIAVASLLLMTWLAREKSRVAVDLGSRAQAAEASQTQLCVWMSAALLMGLGANAAFGWWWADPVAALAIAALAASEGLRTWRAESLDDTCCVQ